jgi:hypothetical protein
MSTKNQSKPADTIPHKFHLSFDKTAKERAELSPDQLAPLNVDPQVASTTAIGAVGRLLLVRDQIVTQLPEFDIAQFDRIGTYAEAFAYSHTVFLAASAPSQPIATLAERATQIRELFLSDANALAKRGLIDGKPLDELKGSVGYLNVASDIGVLVRVFRERWQYISTKSAVQIAELDEAELLFERITLAYAERNQTSTAETAASDDRLRAYTLLVNAYDQARRAVLYIRWSEDDGDTIAPSLWAGRGGHGKAKTDVKAPEKPVVEEPNAHPPVNGGTQPPANGASPTNGAPPAQPVTPGHPGGSPFI